MGFVSRNSLLVFEIYCAMMAAYMPQKVRRRSHLYVVHGCQVVAVWKRVLMIM